MTVDIVAIQASRNAALDAGGDGVEAALDGCRGRQSGVTNILVPRDRTQLATCPGHLRKNVKASSADIVLLGTPSPGPRVNTLM